jgi:hypothetical protein
MHGRRMSVRKSTIFSIVGVEIMIAHNHLSYDFCIHYTSPV